MFVFLSKSVFFLPIRPAEQRDGLFRSAAAGSPSPAGARPGEAPLCSLSEAQKDPRPCGPGILMMLIFFSAQKEALRAVSRRDPGFLA